jgi:hypothetical protein
MRPSISLEANRVAVRHTAQRYKVLNPRVFGSVLRGDDRDGSDLDVLVDPLPGTTLFDLGGLQVELEEILGVPVDLPPRLRQKVLSEAVPI